MMVSSDAARSAAANFLAATGLPTLLGYNSQNRSKPAGKEPPLGGDGVLGLGVISKGVWGISLGERGLWPSSETSCSDALRRFSDDLDA